MEKIRIRDLGWKIFGSGIRDGGIRYTGLECLPAVLKAGGSNPGRGISVSDALVEDRDVYNQVSL
jgi:hypothetical protein